MHRCFPNTIRQRGSRLRVTHLTRGYVVMSGDTCYSGVQIHLLYYPRNPLMSAEAGETSSKASPCCNPASAGSCLKPSSGMASVFYSAQEEWTTSPPAFSCSFLVTLLGISLWALPFLHTKDSAQLTLSRLVSTNIQRRASTVSISDFYQNANFLWKLIETLMLELFEKLS